MISAQKFRPTSALSYLLLLLAAAASIWPSEASCGCSLALASYYVSIGLNLTYISALFGQTPADVVPFNPASPNPDLITTGSRLNVSLTTCDCLSGGNASHGHTFKYAAQAGDTYATIAGTAYSNLTTANTLQAENSFPAVNIPTGASINVTVSCFCGDRSVSEDYGLFITYPLRPGENLSSVAASFGFSGRESLLQNYNPGTNFSAGGEIVYIPIRDQFGSYRPLSSSSGLSAGAIAGISIAVISALVISICIYLGVYRRKKNKKGTMLTSIYEDNSTQPGLGVPLQYPIGYEGADLNMEKSVEFTYEELARATNDFSLASKIGEGGFGAVYYAELRGEKAAIKKMDMEASKEFLAELKVLTRVHHLNLVRLIGFCTEGSLFLIYEYIENGDLSQHLRGRGRDPLPWPARVQIALDSARGLEYIHEHTVPVYIHRDIKSANILIDNKLRAKVADFGLTKLTEVGNASVPTRLVGTFGYMPPEYAQYGDVSPKVDVYAFGVVLYQLISAKEAIIKTGSITESKGLVTTFLDVLNQSDPKENLKKLVDPRLGDDYPLDSVLKMAEIAKACTEEDPQLRPSMRSVVVALMALSSSTGDWDVGHFYGNQALVNLMSGR